MLPRVGLLAVLVLAASGCDRASAPASARQTATTATGTTPRKAPEAFAHVLLISVDGLRPECLEPPLVARFPNFARLLRGPHTLEARTDPDYTVTLPNHLSMLTGRPVLGPSGHGWIANSDPPAVRDGGTLHAQKRSYIPSVFDVAHDHGVTTTMAVMKTKFVLLTQSYSDDSGAPDAVGADDGKQKIDRSFYARSTADLGVIVADDLRRRREPSFAFVHFGTPDAVGHAEDWALSEGSKYLAAVGEVDSALGTILDAVEASPTLARSTAIVLTADHGGGAPARTHTDKTNPINFRVPFVVWLGGGDDRDLRALNPQRAALGRDEQLGSAAAPQPIRNGDAANLCLRLLGLPPIADSTYGFRDPIRVAND